MAARKIVLDAVQHPPTVEVGQIDIQSDRGRLVFHGQPQRRNAERGDNAFETFLARGIQQEAREGKIVFHDQQNVVILPYAGAVIADFVDGPKHFGSGGSHRRSYMRLRHEVNASSDLVQALGVRFERSPIYTFALRGH